MTFSTWLVYLIFQYWNRKSLGMRLYLNLSLFFLLHNNWIYCVTPTHVKTLNNWPVINLFSWNCVCRNIRPITVTKCPVKFKSNWCINDYFKYVQIISVTFLKANNPKSFAREGRWSHWVEDCDGQDSLRSCLGLG